MFLAEEFQKFQDSEPTTLQNVNAQFSQISLAPELCSSRLVDILYIYPSVDKHPDKLFYLVVSDGQQYAIAVTSEKALKECGCFDLSCSMTRCAVITFTKVVHANREAMSKPFAEYLIGLNEGLRVLQVTSLVLQGRGPVLPRPLNQIESPPTIQSEEYDLVNSHEVEFEPISPGSRLPAKFTSKRAPQFAAIHDDTENSELNDSSSQNDSSCVIV